MDDVTRRVERAAQERDPWAVRELARFESSWELAEALRFGDLSPSEQDYFRRTAVEANDALRDRL